MAGSDTTTALRRFGLGARPGDVKAIAADPQLTQEQQTALIRVYESFVGPRE